MGVRSGEIRQSSTGVAESSDPCSVLGAEFCSLECTPSENHAGQDHVCAEHVQSDRDDFDSGTRKHKGGVLKSRFLRSGQIGDVCKNTVDKECSGIVQLS